MAQKLIVASGKGGVGKSSLTVGLARALANKGNKVVVFDFDIGLRSLDLMLGVSKEVLFDWGDILLRRCDPKKAILHMDNAFYFIAAPMQMQQSFTHSELRQLMAAFDKSFQYIFMDAPAGLFHGFQLAASVADRALVVSTPDAVCVRSAGLAARELRSRGLQDVRLIVNRIAKKPITQNKLLNIDEVIDATGVQLLGAVPEDFAVTEYFSKGQALPGRSPAAQAIERIARRIDGEQEPLFIKF